MSANWSLPTVADTIANVIAFFKNRDVDLALGLDPANTSPTNIPDKAIRWNSAAGKWQLLTTGVWGDLIATYAISISGAAGSVPWAGTSSGRPTTLAGYGITDGQPLDSDLTAVAGLTTNGLMTRTATGTVTTRSIAVPTGIAITNADGVAGNPTLALEHDLLALENLATTGIARRTGADAWSVGSLVVTAEITDANVTYAKIQNVSATDMLLGRSSAGAGVIQEVACTSSGRAMIAAASAAAQAALLSVPSAAVQSDQETATSTTTFVTPGRQQYHPSAAKQWCSFNGTGTPAVRSSYNTSSLTDNGVGDWTVNITTAFSSTDNMCPVYAVDRKSGVYNYLILNEVNGSRTTSAVRLFANQVGTAIDAEFVSIHTFGDLP